MKPGGAVELVGEEEEDESPPPSTVVLRRHAAYLLVGDDTRGTESSKGRNGDGSLGGEPRMAI